jgi:hypothetical protein
LKDEEIRGGVVVRAIKFPTVDERMRARGLVGGSVPRWSRTKPLICKSQLIEEHRVFIFPLCMRNACNLFPFLFD